MFSTTLSAKKREKINSLLNFEKMRLKNWKCESAKIGRIGAHGLNCKIFVNSEIRSEIYHKNYHIKKFYVSPSILKFSSLNLAGLYLYCTFSYKRNFTKNPTEDFQNFRQLYRASFFTFDICLKTDLASLSLFPSEL